MWPPSALIVLVLVVVVLDLPGFWQTRVEDEDD
jgi:hypothetical protein